MSCYYQPIFKVRDVVTMAKITVAVLYGGQSPEHDVSVASATNLLRYLDGSLFSILPIKIDKQGKWHVGLYPDMTKDKDGNAMHNMQPSSNSQPIIQALDKLCDVVLPIMHGPLAEDGSIQGLLELARVPYVGSGVLASALGMDKSMARRLVASVGIDVVPYLLVAAHEWQNNAVAVSTRVIQQFSMPLFVKPVSQGSSIGITKVKDLAMLADAINLALRYDNSILIEPAIEPLLEAEVCLLEDLEAGKPPFVSLVGEVRHHDEYYTYAAKYQLGGVEIIVPAELAPELQQLMQRLAGQIFTVLTIAGMARIDFLVNTATQQIYFSEINTIPGFTATSAYPLIMQASGLPTTAVLTRLLYLALQRFSRQKIQHTC
jgi:D-alanine-D-alanine ligase